MNWELRYRWGHAARTSLVLWAVLGLTGALACAPAVRELDAATGWVVFRYSPDGARAVLGAMAGSMLTFIVFVLSATLIVVQLASAQLTPRVIALVLATHGVKVPLGVLTFTYTYTLAALGRIEERVPDLHVSVAVVLNLVSLVVFFRFVQHLSASLRPAAIMLFVSDHGRRVIENVYPQPFDPQQPEPEVGPKLPVQPDRVIPYEGRAGVVMAFSAAELARLARGAGVVVELIPQVGDSVSLGDPMFAVVGGTASATPFRTCVAVGAERTLKQDPRFAFRILVDIANKALSPAINDPTTAVLALDQIDNLLLCLGRRRLDEGTVHDGDGKLRLVYGTPDWPDYVTMAVSEIRHYGGTSLQVDRRLRAMLDHLMRELPEARRQPLEKELVLLSRAVERGFSDEEDRKRAGTADYQGVGGSDQ